MPDEPVQDIELPIEKEVPQPEPQPEQNPLEGVLTLFPGIAGELFGPTQGRDQDRRYKKIVRQKVEQWQENHPGQFQGDTFIRRDSDRQWILNPELKRLYPDLEGQSEQEFDNKHLLLARIYKRTERFRIYHDHNDDPAIRRLHDSIHKKTMAESWSQGTRIRMPGATHPTLSYEQIRARHEQDLTRQFVRDHPTKAKYYSLKDPKIKAAFEEFKEEEWAKSSRLKRAFIRFNDPLSVPDSQRKAWMPKPLRRLSDWYDRKKAAISSRISQRYQKSLLGRGLKRVDRFIAKVFSPFERAQLWLENALARGTKRLGRAMFRPVKALARVSGRGFKRLAMRVIEAFVKRLPGIAGLIGKGAVAIKRFGGQLIRGSLRGLKEVGSQLLKTGVRYGLRVGARIIAGFAVTTAPVWLPFVLIGGGIVVFLFLLIIIIIALFGNNVFTPQTGMVDIFINKSGPTKVDSPTEDNQPELTYTIQVSYTGLPTQITVVDYLPLEVTFENATGPGNPSYSADSHTVTWRINVTSSGVSGSLALPTTFDQARFESYGFPAPEDPNPIVLDGEALERWKTYVLPHAIKAANVTGVDIGVIGMWPFLEGGFVPFDNCDSEHRVSSDGDDNHNTECFLWGDYWQIGLANHPAYTYQFVESAFDTMYRDHSDEIVQEVGQRVIDESPTRAGVQYTYVSEFPTVPLSTIVDRSAPAIADHEMRNLLSILMKDDAIGMYLIARHFKENIGLDSGMAAQMEGWDSTYYNRQKIINYIKAIYDASQSASSPSPEASPQASEDESVLQAADDVCGEEIDFSRFDFPNGFEKKLLTLHGDCVIPQTIVMHTTAGSTTADATYDYFESGGGRSRGVGSHFSIGQDGKVIQMTRMYKDKVDWVQTVGDFKPHISIEMGSSEEAPVYESRSEMSPDQYRAAKTLVKALASTYNIPLGNLEWDCSEPLSQFQIQNGVTKLYPDLKDCTGFYTQKGIYGHYQMSPSIRTDPGKGWMRDFREELKAEGLSSSLGSDIPLSGTVPPLTITATLNADVTDTFILNRATATAFGGGTASTTNTNGMIDIESASLQETFKNAAEREGIPPALLLAVNKMETAAIDTWTDSDYERFSETNWWQNATQEEIDRGWAFNTCDRLGTCFPGADVRGIMQFELDTWNGYASRLNFPDSHTPDRRYPLDSVYAGAMLLNNHRETYDSAHGTSPNDWPEDKVRRVGGAYCAGNINANFADPACSHRGDSYDTLVWRYFQEYQAQGL